MSPRNVWEKSTLFRHTVQFVTVMVAVFRTACLKCRQVLAPASMDAHHLVQNTHVNRLDGSPSTPWQHRTICALMCMGSIPVVAHVEACMSYDGMVNQKKKKEESCYLDFWSSNLCSSRQRFRMLPLWVTENYSASYTSVCSPIKWGRITQPFLGSILGITN